jgi:hypothetical protein
MDIFLSVCDFGHLQSICCRVAPEETAALAQRLIEATYKKQGGQEGGDSVPPLPPGNFMLIISDHYNDNVK